MNYIEIGKSIAAAGLPLLGGALAGPAGASIGALIASRLGLSDSKPETIAAAVDNITANGEQFIQLKRIEADHEEKLLQISVDAEVALAKAETERLVAVNTTMQAESKSEHWAQWSWRPFCGFSFGATWIGTYAILPLMKIPSPVIPVEGWLAMGAVLGVASWWRGKQKAGEA